MYPPELLSHFENPRNPGTLPGPALSAQVSNPACGDVLRLSARLEAGVVAEARFSASGCPAAIAAGSAATVLLTGSSRDSASRLTTRDIDAMLGGLPAASRHAADLAVDGIRALLKQWPA